MNQKDITRWRNAVLAAKRVLRDAEAAGYVPCSDGLCPERAVAVARDEERCADHLRGVDQFRPLVGRRAA